MRIIRNRRSLVFLIRRTLLRPARVYAASWQVSPRCSTRKATNDRASVGTRFVASWNPERWRSLDLGQDGTWPYRIGGLDRASAGIVAGQALRGSFDRFSESDRFLSPDFETLFGHP